MAAAIIEGEARRALTGDEVEVRSLPPDHGAQSYYGVDGPRLRQAHRHQGQFEGSRHPGHGHGHGLDTAVLETAVLVTASPITSPDGESPQAPGEDAAAHPQATIRSHVPGAHPGVTPQEAASAVERAIVADQASSGQPSSGQAS